MPPPNNTFGGGTTETVLGTGVLVLMVIAILLVFLLPRRWSLVPLMFAIFLSAQSLMIGGFHLFVSRILILAGLGCAMASRSPNSHLFGGGYNAVDTLFILYAIFHVSAFVLLYQELGALANQLGFLWISWEGIF